MNNNLQIKNKLANHFNPKNRLSGYFGKQILLQLQKKHNLTAKNDKILNQKPSLTYIC